MAVTLTLADLSRAIRLGATVAETTEAQRILDYAVLAIEKYVPTAPDEIHNEAARRLVGYLYDVPTASRGAAFADGLVNSGAAAALLPYRLHRAGSTAEAVSLAQVAVGSVGNPVVDVVTDVATGTLTVSFADGTSRTEALPAGMAGVTPVPDATADLLVERLGTVENPVLPSSRVWLALGITVPDTVHVLMVDAGQVTDDYHLVDWDAVLLMHDAGVAGQPSLPGTFETFQGDAFTTIRVGHDGNHGILVAAEQTDELALLHIHVERLLAPVHSVGLGVDQTARNAAAAAQTRADGAASALSALLGHRVIVQTSALNIAMDSPPSTAGVLCFTLSAGTLKLYRRLDSDASPYWSLIGTVSGGAGGSVTIGSLVPYIESWAFIGNDGVIPSTKSGLNAVQPWALAGGVDIPYSHLNTLLEPWAVILDEAARDLGAVPEIIPHERLPVAQLLPSPTSLADGQVATIASGMWTAATNDGGTGVASKQWRFDFVRGEDTADPIAAAGQVFVELRYLDQYNAEGVRTSVQDVGAGFLSADGSRVLSSSNALDVKGLLAQSSLAAVMQLVANLPTPGDATWGEWYGLADTQGRVKDVYYRREESRTEQLWLPARLNAQNRNLHGFSTLNSTLTYGYERGGALSPEAGIVELVEERDAGGNIVTRLIIPKSSPLNSLISVILFYKSDGQSGYTTARELPLFHDTTFSSGQSNRYVSAVTTGEFRFVPGTAYTIKWRNAGQAHDLVIQPAEALRRVVDEEELAEAVAKINRELYETEDRVAVVEARSSYVRRELYNQDFNITAQGANAFQTVTGVTIPTAGWGAVRFGGDPVQSLEIHTFGWADLPTATAGTPTQGYHSIASIGGGAYSFWLARTAADVLLIGALNSTSDPSPLQLWDLG